MIGKLFITCCLLCAMLCSAAGQGTGQPERQNNMSEQEVRKLEREWLDAYEQHDSEAMNRIVADDFTITYPNGGMQTKEQIIKFLKLPPNPAMPTPKFSTEDVQARVYGNTVILTGRLVTQMQRGSETLKEMSRYTDTYVKLDGRWRVVASHLSNIQAPRPRTP